MRFLLAALALTISSDRAGAALDGTAMADTMRAVRADDWSFARSIAPGPVARDIVEWRYLRAGHGDWGEITAFLDQRGDWPGLARIRAEGEGKIPAGAAPARVRAFFGDRRPTTGVGALRLARAYRAQGLTGDAAAEAVLAWRTLPLTDTAQAAFLNLYPERLAAHHVARLDAMLWQGHEVSARRMLALVPEGWRKLARARLALRDMTPGVDALIEAVPDALADDPGLAYERFLWRARKGRDAAAVEMLRARSDSAADLGRPKAWSGWRRVFARSAMQAGAAGRAYELASTHRMMRSAEGYTYAALEWLAGYVALEELDRPETALAHFRNFDAVVETPISSGRGGYWRGRALAALGRDAAAAEAYAAAAAYQTSFYGLLAAERAGLPMDPRLTGEADYPDPEAAGFADSSVLAAARLFVAAGERNLAEWFLTHLAATLDRDGQGALAELALSLEEPHLALMIAKEAAKEGHILPRTYFPLTDLAERDLPVPRELALAIARRESEFDPVVVSGAGARGLMQLMPATARQVAGELDLGYSALRLISDSGYNATLGTAYLARLMDTFDGAAPLAAAGYNAGPGRPLRWIEELGDPRDPDVDPVRWIEMIPFRETRNYVMRIMESLPVYRARLSGEVQEIALSEELGGVTRDP